MNSLRPTTPQGSILAAGISALVVLGQLACNGVGPTTVQTPRVTSSAARFPAETPYYSPTSQSRGGAGGRAAQSISMTSALPDEWRPAAPPRRWKFIVLHHSATAQGSVAQIDAEHRTRIDSQGEPWLGIGYDFVIGNGDGMPDGAVEPTFRWRDQIHGAHSGLRLYNDEGIGICLIGNFEQAPPTSAQVASTRRLIAALQADNDIPRASILKHGDLVATQCPGRLFPFEEIVSAPPPTFVQPAAHSATNAPLSHSWQDAPKRPSGY